MTKITNCTDFSHVFESKKRVDLSKQKITIMKLCNVSFSTVLLRFYLMMVVIIAAFLVGYPLLALIGVPIFLTALMGVDFEMNKILKFSAKTQKENSLKKLYPNNQNKWNISRNTINNLGYNITKIFQISNNN